MYPVDQTMDLFHEEQFGPVIPVVSFSNIDQPLNDRLILNMVNKSVYLVKI